MSDANTITLIGKLIKPTIKTVQQGRYKFFQFRVDTDGSFPPMISTFLVDGEKQNDIERYRLNALIDKHAEEGMYVAVHDAYINGDRKSDGWQFWNIDAKLSNITWIPSDASVQPVNVATFTGKVVEIEETTEEGTFVIIGSGHYSRNPKDPNDKGSVKDRHIRIFVPSPLDSQNINVDSKVVCAGTVAGKYKDDFNLHVYAVTFAVF